MGEKRHVVKLKSLNLFTDSNFAGCFVSVLFNFSVEFSCQLYLCSVLSVESTLFSFRIEKNRKEIRRIFFSIRWKMKTEKSHKNNSNNNINLTDLWSKHIFHSPSHSHAIYVTIKSKLKIDIVTVSLGRIELHTKTLSTREFVQWNFTPFVSIHERPSQFKLNFNCFSNNFIRKLIRISNKNHFRNKQSCSNCNFWTIWSSIKGEKLSRLLEKPNWMALYLLTTNWISWNYAHASNFKPN